MTDPLSVTAAIVGLASVSAHVSNKLIQFTKSTNNAPKQAQIVLAEVRDLEGIIDHCKDLILGTESTNKAGASVVLVEHVVVILSGCVMTFSELEEVIGCLNIEGDLDVVDCVKWARKESKIALITGRLQNHKASLTAMLTILGCTNQLEAKRSLDYLNTLVRQLVTANQDLFGRIRDIELRQGMKLDDESFSAPPETPRSLLVRFDKTLVGEGSEEDANKEANKEATLNQKLEAAFHKDLNSSRVYRRARKDDDRMSQISSATRATPWSMLSELSLAEVSAVSVIALPIFSSEITNSQHYFLSDTMNIRISGMHDPNPDFDLQLRTIMFSPSVTNIAIANPWRGKRWSINPVKTRSQEIFDDLSNGGIWSKSFSRHPSAVWNVIFNTLAFPEFKTTPRTLGVKGLRSLHKTRHLASRLWGWRRFSEDGLHRHSRISPQYKTITAPMANKLP